jgi:hypothetical protein
MARSADETRLKEVFDLFQSKPGHKAGEYARMLRIHREDFSRVLVQLNDRGILLSEDEKGRLWPFNKDSF